MTKSIPLATAVLAASLALASCSGLSTTEQGALSGGVIGAAGGAALGALTGGVSVVGGALVGGGAGAAIGAITADHRR